MFLSVFELFVYTSCKSTMDDFVVGDIVHVRKTSSSSSPTFDLLSSWFFLCCAIQYI